MKEAPASPPLPPPPPGEYTHSFTFHATGTWLPFVPPVCVVLIFVLSFFTWHLPNLMLWNLSFSDPVHYGFLTYTLLMLFPVGLAVIASAVLDKIAPPPVVPFLHWKSLATGLLLGLTFLLLLYDYVYAQFTVLNPIGLAFAIAIRLHCLAMLASFGMFWLHWRKRSNLPPPKMEVRW